MAKSRQSKETEVSSIVEATSGAKGVVFANFAGLSVADVSTLRRKCRAAGVRYTVAKKTLMKRAFEEAGISALDPKSLPGGVAVIFGYDDEVTAAKLLNDFAKDHESLTFAGGLIASPSGWQALNIDEVKTLAKLPGKQELLGQLVSVLAGPMRGFVTVLSGPSRSFVQVLNAMAAKT